MASRLLFFNLCFIRGEHFVNGHDQKPNLAVPSRAKGFLDVSVKGEKPHAQRGGFPQSFHSKAHTHFARGHCRKGKSELRFPYPRPWLPIDLKTIRRNLSDAAKDGSPRKPAFEKPIYGCSAHVCVEEEQPLGLSRTCRWQKQDDPQGKHSSHARKVQPASKWAPRLLLLREGVIHMAGRATLDGRRHKGAMHE